MLCNCAAAQLRGWRITSRPHICFEGFLMIEYCCRENASTYVLSCKISKHLTLLCGDLHQKYMELLKVLVRIHTST